MTKGTTMALPPVLNARTALNEAVRRTREADNLIVRGDAGDMQRAQALAALAAALATLSGVLDDQEG